jgi:hypothetical protein
MIPQEAQQHAADGGSCVDDPPRRPTRRHHQAAHTCSAGDHDKTLESKQQQTAALRDENPLYQRLMRETGMDEGLARRVALNAPADLSAFEADLASAPAGLSVPAVFWLCAIWARGTRPAPRTARTTPQARRFDPTANRPELPRETWQRPEGALTGEAFRAKVRALRGEAGV